jgi:hypothetical protein
VKGGVKLDFVDIPDKRHGTIDFDDELLANKWKVESHSSGIVDLHPSRHKDSIP